MANQKQFKSRKFKSRGSKDKEFIKEEPRKDSSSKRVNFDNMSQSEFSKLFTRKDSNHVDWVLKKDPASVKLAASIGFSAVPGRGNGFYNAVPGIMRYTWMPTFGSPDSDVLSALKESLYSYVVHANSRNKLYDPNDLLMLVLGCMEVFTKINEMKRVYGLMREWNGSNEYTPDVIIRMMGYNFKDLQFRYPMMLDQLNLLIAEAKQLWIPNTFPVLDRYLWLASNIFMDANTPKAQYFIPVRGMYFMYHETLTKSGGALVPASYNIDPTSTAFYDTIFNLNPTDSNISHNFSVLTWEEHCNMLKNMIRALRNSQDRGIICGDILKAYGPEKIIMPEFLSPEYKTVPSYNPEVQMQIENMNTCLLYPTILFQDIDSNTLQIGYEGNKTTESASVPSRSSYVPSTSATLGSQKFCPNAGLLNFHQSGNPTPEEVLVATRHLTLGMAWNVAWYPFDKSGTTTYKVFYGFKPYCAGTTMVTSIDLVGADKPSANVQPLPVTADSWASIGWHAIGDDSPRVCRNGVVTNEANYSLLGALASFDWHPPYYKAKNFSSPTNIESNLSSMGGYPLNMVDVSTDFEQYTAISKEVISNIHQLCSFSEFDVPVLG